MTAVRQDDKGLYIKTGGYIFRPGYITGLSHAVNTDHAMLQAGDTVKARHVPSTTYAKLRLSDGYVTFWSTDYAHEKQADMEAAIKARRGG